MKRFAKILSALTILCMLTTSVFAVELAGEIKDGDPGLIELDFKLTSFPDDIKDISAVTVRYTFDESKISFVTVKSDLLPGIMSTAGNILWYDSTPDASGAVSAEKLTEAQGILCTVVFEKAENASGNTDITITLAEFADSSFKVSEEITANTISVALGDNDDNISGGTGDNTDDGTEDDNTSDGTEGGTGDNDETGDGSTDDNTGSDNTGDNSGNNSTGDNTTGNSGNTGNDNNNTSTGNKDKNKGSSSKGSGGISVPPVVQAPVTEIFGDIPLESWAYEHAYALMQKGIIAGDGSTKPNMRPNDNITREEAVKIALLAMGAQPEQGLSADFADASDISDWALPYITTAVKLGIINGYSDGTIGAKKLITREQMLTILARAMKWDIQEGELGFADNAEVSEWARDSIAHAVKLGVMTGYTDNTVRPKANITRAETFALVNRCIK